MIYRAIYTLLLSLLSPLLLWGLYAPKEGKPTFGRRWKEHFGFTSALEPTEKTSAEPPIWVHAVSVGEVMAAIPLLKALQKRYPEQTIVVTTTTSTGAQRVEQLGHGIIHRYMPIDFSWCVKGFLKIIQPKAMLIIETELWPNTLQAVKQKNIPIILINGRLSERSLHRYRKLGGLMRQTIANVDKVLCLHEDDAQRFKSLGVEPHRLEVTGSIKFDISVNAQVIEKGLQLRGYLGQQRPVWIAASTHQGEDEQIIEAFRVAKIKIENLLLILVPRHPERFSPVAELAVNLGYNIERRTQSSGDKLHDTVDIYLGDTMGEMMTMFAASDIVFMGGSLVGDKVGGHNFIEPAALAKPCFSGPSYFNFADLAQQLIDVDALNVCYSSDELAHHIVALLLDASALEKAGNAAYNVVLKNQGAVNKTLLNVDSVI